MVCPWFKTPPPIHRCKSPVISVWCSPFWTGSRRWDVLFIKRLLIGRSVRCKYHRHAALVRCSFVRIRYYVAVRVVPSYARVLSCEVSLHCMYRSSDMHPIHSPATRAAACGRRYIRSTVCDTTCISHPPGPTFHARYLHSSWDSAGAQKVSVGSISPRAFRRRIVRYWHPRWLSSN